MKMKPAFLAYLLAISGTTDFILVVAIVFNAVTHGVKNHPVAISLFAFTILLFLLSGFFAIRMATHGRGLPFTKPILLIASVVHVVLGLLIQLGPGALYLITALVLIGTVYFLSSFKIPKAPIQAT
ncbi:hypothetical protein [Geothrix campi]|uniref:hypothetical protein n=1 Tax=Geothrix campi TaxID=2966450 RepID=UPI002149382D|nr:hypothetical protein [Geothrix sp. SG10]